MRKTIAPCKKSNNTNMKEDATPGGKNNNKRRIAPLMRNKQ
jgi:hypothetical protein